jgi:hypothetical protein
MHGQRSEGAEALGLVFDLLVDVVVYEAGETETFCWVGDILESWRCVGEDVVAAGCLISWSVGEVEEDLHSVFICVAETDLIDVADFSDVFLGVDCEEAGPPFGFLGEVGEVEVVFDCYLS